MHIIDLAMDCNKKKERTTQVRQVKASRILDIANILAGWHLIDVFVGPYADLILLTLEQTPDNTSPKGKNAVWHASRAGHLHHFRIYHHIYEGAMETIDLPQTQHFFHFAQPIGSNGWLVAQAWGLENHHAWSGGVHNAFVYSTEGQLQYSFYAGDGIEDIQTDEVSSIWVSFFDQGILDGGEPAREGLVCFNATGQLVWAYNGMMKTPHILDCHAMNISSQKEIWVYSYPGFPLVRLLDRQIDRIWGNVPVGYYHAFAVNGKKVLFAERRHDNKLMLPLVELDTMRVEELVAVNEEGDPLSFHRACGRGPLLYLVTEQSVFLLDLDTL
jgi:hypothetical protein